MRVAKSSFEVQTAKTDALQLGTGCQVKNKVKAIHCDRNDCTNVRNELMHGQPVGFILREAYLCHSFHGACGEIGRGESETAVGASIERLEVEGRLLFPLVALAQVNAVHPHKPVWTGNHLYHQGQLWIRENAVQNLCGLHLSSTKFAERADTC